MLPSKRHDSGKFPSGGCKGADLTLDFFDNQEKIRMMMPASVISPSQLKKPSSSAAKAKISAPKPKKSWKIGGSQGAPGAASLGTKLTKIISPKHHVQKLRDMYVAFMVSLASSKRMTLASTTGIYGGWPCLVQPLVYPGRWPREDKLMEELECANRTVKVKIPQGGPPPCARKAVFPL